MARSSHDMSKSALTGFVRKAIEPARKTAASTSLSPCAVIMMTGGCDGILLNVWSISTPDIRGIVTSGLGGLVELAGEIMPQKHLHPLAAGPVRNPTS